MKARYREKIIQTKDVKEAVDIEWNKRIDQVYDSVKRDCSAQLLAVIFYALKVNHKHSNKYLQSFKREIEDIFELMQSGVFGRKFDTQDCINFMRDECGIDFDGKEGVENGK